MEQQTDWHHAAMHSIPPYLHLLVATNCSSKNKRTFLFLFFGKEGFLFMCNACGRSPQSPTRSERNQGALDKEAGLCATNSQLFFSLWECPASLTTEPEVPPAGPGGMYGGQLRTKESYKEQNRLAASVSLLRCIRLCFPLAANPDELPNKNQNLTESCQRRFPGNRQIALQKGSATMESKVNCGFQLLASWRKGIVDNVATVAVKRANTEIVFLVDQGESSSDAILSCHCSAQVYIGLHLLDLP